MAWFSRKKKDHDVPSDDYGTEWIHQTTLEEAMENFRVTLKENGLHGLEVDAGIVRTSHIGIMRGRPRKVAPMLMDLLERREREGRLTWELVEGRSLLGVTIVRLIAAYLEDPAIPVSKARAGAERFLRSIEPYPGFASVRKIMPMIMAVRTKPQPADFRAEKRRICMPSRQNIESSGMCAAAHRQWHVEYLLAEGAEDEALDMANCGRSEKPCASTCSFAPHSMNAWLLEPLHRRGAREEARLMEERLASLLSTQLRYLDPMGCRIHYLALENRFADAGKIVESMLPLAKEELASPWQRLKFYESCARALELARSNADRKALLAADGGELENLRTEIYTQRDELRAAFAKRAA